MLQHQLRPAGRRQSKSRHAAPHHRIGKSRRCVSQHHDPLNFYRWASRPAKSITRLYGPYIEDWAGKDITLFASKVKVAGEVVECLRVRPTVVPLEAPKPPLQAKRFAAALESIKKGERTAAFVRERFTLTDAQDAELKALETTNA